ncbi:MAG: hypothetical protein IMZ59_01145 [Actinobacteria bacterium]|nr:hypothetical protein [Actinomycetota bacterium]
MDTKEAIKFIREEDYMFCDNLPMEEIYDYSDKLKEIADILEELEKYKEMWEELRIQWGRSVVVKEIEQKYFPKE